MTTTTEATPALRDVSEFPLDTFRDAARELRRPFTAAAVKFKVQATWPKDNPTGGLIVCYIDARLVVERLNLILPDRWSDGYEPTAKGLMWCHLTVDGITRSDIGEGDGKGLVSDALKRAAVKFGIGVSLYATPKMILNVNDGHLKVKRTNKGPSLELTPNGETRVRDIYSAWLDVRGAQAFGSPLDHGDADDAQGDAETGELPAEAITDDAPSEPRRGEIPPLDSPDPAPANGNGAHVDPNARIGQQLLDELVATKQSARLPDTEQAREWMRQTLTKIGVSDVPDRVTLATLRRLTHAQGSTLLDVLTEIVNKRAEQEAAEGQVSA